MKRITQHCTCEKGLPSPFAAKFSGEHVTLKTALLLCMDTVASKM
jgi:hypothetical protein